MFQWYLETLGRYALVAAAIVGLMFLTYRGLRAVGVRREPATGFALILPWFLGFLIWNLFPLVASLYLSLTDYNILQAPNVVGLANYQKILGDDEVFWASLRLTMAYSAITVPLGLFLSLLAAMLLNQGVRGVGLWRTLYYMPAILPAFVTALLWRLMLLPTKSGLVNSATEPIWSLFGDTAPRWFLDPGTVLWGFVIMSFWGVFGANTVIMLAGLKNIPKDLYEASEVDGAGLLSKFRHITVPMLTPTLFYVLIMGIIAGVQVFDQGLFVKVPRENFLNVYLYQQGFNFFHMGYASAIAWVMFVIILVLALAVFRSSSAWVYYEGEVKR
ncbi:MAG: sugar ABC transporter permease [Candidatus Dormibacteraeota bacterium]|nr:sugar ABC transporter permease [Candidatus Dormibacteraeota bacterium]